MNIKTCFTLGLVIACAPLAADTMTLKIPLKVVLMRDEAKAVRVQCVVRAHPYSSGAAAASAIANNSAPTPVYGSSELYPLDPFGNLDQEIPVEINLDEMQNLTGHILQAKPSYACKPEFVNDAGDVVLSEYTPQNNTDRSQLYDTEQSTFYVEAFNFVPDAPSRMETMLGGRKNTVNSGLENPTQDLKLQR